jgi:predicted HTH domain antitoxin
MLCKRVTRFLIDVDGDAEILRESGGYGSQSEVLEDAFRALLKENPGLRVEFAVEKYKSGPVSLNRAAEIAGKSSEEFKEILEDRGIKRDIGFLSEEERETRLNEL